MDMFRTLILHLSYWHFMHFDIVSTKHIAYISFLLYIRREHSHSFAGFNLIIIIIIYK